LPWDRRSNQIRAGSTTFITFITIITVVVACLEDSLTKERAARLTQQKD
jgi:hypothetical protein